MAAAQSPDSLSPITVTNPNDSGPGSLRQAILDANGQPGPTHTINFSIPAGSQTINLLSSLPRATTVPDVMVLDATQNVTVISPSASDQNNFGALIKTGAGTLTISGANNLVGNIEVDGSSFRISDSIAATLAAGIVANVQGTGTLELAGSVSALAGGANGVKVSNNSAAPAGLLVSGSSQVVGEIDGTGNVLVDVGGGLTANHIVQNTLVIGGAPGNAGTVTIAASDAAGQPLGDPQPLGPVQGVDGEPLAELWPFGGMVANGNAFARGPVLFTTQAGTVLAMMRYQANSQDNSGDNNIYVRRSYDNGKTFGPATIISPPPLAGDAALLASWGGTSWALTTAGPDLVQRQDGTIYLFYSQTRTGGPQAVAQRQYVYRYMTSNDDGLTWSTPTDITAATIFAGNQNVATITSVTDPTPGVVRLGLIFKTSFGSLPAARALIKISGLANDPMGLNGNSYWISNVVSNTTGHSAVVELAGTPIWRDGTTIGPGSLVTPQSVWLGTVGGGEPILRSNRILIPLYYRYDTSGSGFEPFVGCIYSDDGVTFSQGTLADETQAAIYSVGGMLEPHFTELSTDNHLYISCNTKGSFHGHMTSSDGGRTWTFGLDDGTGGSTLLNVVSTPAPVIALGGGRYVMVLPDNSTHRLRLTAFLSTDECATWSQQLPLFSGTAWYSDLCLAGGNILCAYERGHTDTDFNYQGIGGATIGQIGLVTFNLAAVTTGIMEQVAYDFNELPVGQKAWAGSASIVDYGTGDHRATTVGAATYAVDPAGNGQSALTFHSGDSLLLSNQVDPTFDPDFLATDSGDFTFEFGYRIANHGYGCLLGGDSGVGSGTKGVRIVVNPNGTVTMIVDDGAHHASITSIVDATNDGLYHRVICQRDVATGELRMWTFLGNGALTETVAPVADPTTIARGSLSNGIDPKYLCRPGNTTAGGMTQDITFDMFRFIKQALTIDRFTPTPYYAPVPELLPAPRAGTPDTVASSNLQLWLLDSRGGYSVRTNRGSSPTPANPPVGYGADYLLDSSGHGYFTSTVASSFWRGVDPNVGGYWTVPGDLVPKSLDNSTIGQFDFVSRFSSAWTIAGMFRFPSANITDTEVVFSNFDGSQHGFELGTAYGTTRRFWLQAENERGNFLGEVTYPDGNGQYAADTWYYFALVFNGNGGTGNGGAQGLSAYLIPLTGTPLTVSDVAGDKSANLTGGVLSGNTAVATTGSTAALKFGGGASSESLMSDLGIWNTALTDADIQTLANGHLASGQRPSLLDISTVTTATPNSAPLKGLGDSSVGSMSGAALAGNTFFGNPDFHDGGLIGGTAPKRPLTELDNQPNPEMESSIASATLDVRASAAAMMSLKRATMGGSLEIVSAGRQADSPRPKFARGAAIDAVLEQGDLMPTSIEFLFYDLLANEVQHLSE